MERIAEITEPLYGYKQEFGIASVDELQVIEIQRKPSNMHVARLARSIQRIGFVTPLIVIRRGEKLVIIDGQHRFLAGKQVGITRFPVIVVPEKYAPLLKEMNVEKTMSIREVAYVSLNLYRQWLEKKPDIHETDVEIMDSIDSAHYVTLGIGYEMTRLYGSAFESIMKRVDGFVDKPLSEAYEIRKKRAEMLVKANDLARQLVEKLRELGVEQTPFLMNEIISKVNPIGRKRIVTMTFEEVFRIMIKKLEDFVEAPNKFLELTRGETT